jgi:riboflavin synthase
MFTGLIRGIGRVRALRGSELLLEGSPFKDLKGGESICVNGCCLTVSRMDKGVLCFDLSRETLERSHRSLWTPGTQVNLERALTLQDPLDGHLVTGHVDGLGKIEKASRAPSWTLGVAYPKEFDPLIVEKGSIAVHGVSLTVARLLPRFRFEAAIVPETLKRTTLGRLKPGARVHLEFDIMGKYLVKRTPRT